MKLTKKQKTLVSLDKNKVYSIADAIEVLRPYCSSKFDETLEIAVRLGIDVTKADQNIRGMLSLPNGTGKQVRVAVFTVNSQDEAKKAGADVVGGEELIEQVAAGNINFDRVIATPDMMPKMSKVARVLGPKGLMPNPKLGTVTNNVAEAVKTAKAGQIEYRAEKKGIIHAGIGKMSFSTEKLVENANALIE
ncbi:MAG: 50S ribosomal protein L1, partial [Alphaproteobacteria bacterium]